MYFLCICKFSNTGRISQLCFLTAMLFFESDLYLKKCKRKSVIHGFKDSVSVRKLHACCWDMQKFRAKQAALVVVFKAKAVYNRF